MKKIFWTSLCLVLAWACSHPEVEVADFDTFHVSSVSSSDVLVGNSLNPDIHMMELGEEEETKVADIAAVDLVKEILGMINSNRLIHIAGTYVGHDIDGSALTQSGKVLLPAKGPIKNMLIVSHFTIGANYECPSECFPLEGILASRGYAVVIADYIGFGVTRDRVHPYMHVESTARSVVDMALAVKPFLEHIGRKPESDEVILLGYSQGGSTTVAVMNMLQSEYNRELPIKKVYAGGGPYDLKETYHQYLAEGSAKLPSAVVSILMAYNEYFQLDIPYSSMFQGATLEHLDDWWLSKQFSTTEIDRKMGSKDITTFIAPPLRDLDSNVSRRMMEALDTESLCRGWKPRKDENIFLLHHNADDIAPAVNTEHLYDFLKEQGVENVEMQQADFFTLGISEHISGAAAFLTLVAKWIRDNYTIK